MLLVSSSNLQHNLVLFGASVAAGAVNAVAGGGTLLTFPALLWAGETAKIANATSTVALWPGQLSSLLAYRKEIGESREVILRLGAPSLLGGGVGAFLLLHTPSALFAHLVPYLILLATLLFMLQEPLARTQRARALAAQPEVNLEEAPDEPISPRAWGAVMLFQFGVAIYGGYFGAGIGILMLAALGLIGFRNIHRMNGLKNINGLCINAVAAVMFMASGLVQWHTAGLMILGAMVGGYTGAGTARRIGQRNVRRIVILIGLSLSLSLLLKH